MPLLDKASDLSDLSDLSEILLRGLELLRELLLLIPRD